MTRKYLKKFRSACELSQQKTARAINVSESYYNLIELGKRQINMTYSMMEKLATAFEIPVKAIIDAETAYIAARRESA